MEIYRSFNTNPCVLLLLVGLKGAGKTFIGHVLEKQLEIEFLQIEPIFRSKDSAVFQLMCYSVNK